MIGIISDELEQVLSGFFKGLLFWEAGPMELN